MHDIQRRNTVSIFVRPTLTALNCAVSEFQGGRNQHIHKYIFGENVQ